MYNKIGASIKGYANGKVYGGSMIDDMYSLLAQCAECEDTSPEQISERVYTKRILKKLEDNHIWLNKLVYFNPTDEQKIKLAEMILDKLQEKSTQIPSHGITSEFRTIRELAELTPELYLRVNWS
jgi:hypothetical protein